MVLLNVTTQNAYIHHHHRKSSFRVDGQPKGSNVLDHTRGCSAGLSAPPGDVTMAGGSAAAGPVRMDSGDPSHQSALVEREGCGSFSCGAKE